MTLERRLREMIVSGGPLPVSVYMQLCLHDPEAGYYSTQPGLGRDFITAPGLSQVFGELLGLWAVHEWQVMGRPDPFILAELGPGRATMMNDALRAVRVHTDFLTAMRLHLVEASARLREIQALRLATYRPAFADELASLPDAPMICLANEFLDCLPARQFVELDGQWHERVVGLDAQGRFRLGLAVDMVPGAELQASAGRQVRELDLQPGLEIVISALAQRAGPFRALFIDYGSLTPPGDTLRAFRENVQVDPLEQPGTCDLTVDVDFGRLRRLAEKAGLGVDGPALQGPFLGGLGIQQRLDQLIAGQDKQAEVIFKAVSRLVDPGEMGERFKVICLSSPGLPGATGFAMNRLKGEAK